MLRLAHALRKRWWRIAKPYLRGCRIIALDNGDRVLLVRHAYGSGSWMTPGGGLNRGEAPIAGAMRELREETRCILHEPVEIALSEEPLHGTLNGVHIVAGRTASTPRADGREIVEARFFPADALPVDMPPMFRAHLPAWITAAIAAHPVDDPLRLESRPPATTA
jgi:ADP-ribose pyrophosphatase YjhB (NUDIX family)